MRRLQADPEFDPRFALLMDFREATAAELSHEEIVELSNFHAFTDESKRAYVVATPEQFGLARMFGSYRSLAKMDVYRVFTGMGEAIAWLDLESPPAPQP